MLARIPRVENVNVLVGFDTADDAGVYKLSSQSALVQTVDFFTPIVDDPATFGAIAAANALSDVYAMGGVPLTALSILCYPNNGDLDVLAEILAGGAAKMQEAGCVVIGGHSVNDEEIKFGYAITGHVHPSRVWANRGAMSGDVLVFTKGLGTGVISTALKREMARPEDVESAIDSMTRLNRVARDVLSEHPVNACTDVSGFGLLGHAREMALASNVTLEIAPASVQLLPGAADYARRGAIPGGLNNNREFIAPCVAVECEISRELEDLLYDPQTSGGLLASVPAESARDLEQNHRDFYIIGKAIEFSGKPLVLR